MRPHLLCATLAMFVAPALNGQATEKPRLGFEIATTRFSASAHDNGTPQTKLSLYKPAMFTLRFTSHIGEVGIGLSVARSWADFGSRDGTGFTIIQEDQVRLWEFSPELRYALVRTQSGGRLYIHGGIAMDHWTIEELDPRTKWGVIAGVTAAGNLGNGWDVNFRIDGASSGSIFNEDEAGGGISIDGTRRLQLGVGLSRQL